MLHVIWAILNIALFCYLLVLSFRIIKLVREKMGLLAAIFFVFVLLSFGNRDKQERPREVEKWYFNGFNREMENRSMPAGSTRIHNNFSRIVLSKNLAFKVTLCIGYTTGAGGAAPAFAYTSMEGFTGSHEWKTHWISVNATETPGRFRYSLNATTYWRMLGFNLIGSSNLYEGTVDIER